MKILGHHLKEMIQNFWGVKAQESEFYTIIPGDSDAKRNRTTLGEKKLQMILLLNHFTFVCVCVPIMRSNVLCAWQ